MYLVSEMSSTTVQFLRCGSPFIPASRLRPDPVVCAIRYRAGRRVPPGPSRWYQSTSRWVRSRANNPIAGPYRSGHDTPPGATNVHRTDAVLRWSYDNSR